jgi:hypothetical protein
MNMGWRWMHEKWIDETTHEKLAIAIETSKVVLSLSGISWRYATTRYNTVIAHL